MTDSTQIDRVETYLRDLYGPDPDGLLWIGGHADGWKGRTFHTAQGAAAYAVDLDARGGQGVYHRSTTLARVPERRGDAADSAAAYFFALDIDLAGPGHKAENLPSDLDDAMRLVQEAGLPMPTLWIHSGGGLYPQWRLPAPLDVRDPATQKWVTETFSALAAHCIAAAARLGWHLDNVRDLARVFRLPGTTNRKVAGQEVGARILAGAGTGHAYDLGELAAALRRAQPRASVETPAPAPTPAGLEPLYDAAEDHVFTHDQAKAFIKTASERLETTQTGYNAAINDFAMACAHFPWLVTREQCATQMIKVLGGRLGWTAPDADDKATIDSAYKATESGKSWIAPDPGPAANSQADEVHARILPPPSRPLDVARELKALLPSTHGQAHRAWWRGDFYRWTGAHWDMEDQATIEQWLYRRTGDAVYLQPKKGKTEDGKKPELEEIPWAPTRRRIGDVAHALGVGELQRTGEPDKVLAVTNGVLAGRDLLPHSPTRFNLFSLPFAYQPDATAPLWQEYLDQVLPDDRESQEFLGEWFGYVISGRTDQHKIAALVGKKRSGKGTAARVLGALLGKENVAGVNLTTLGGTFGLQPFIGAALGVASDVRWNSRAIGDAVQILLEISGGDVQTVHRKNEKAWKGALGVRFMLMSNDTPTFSDRSGALVDRMIYIAFRQTFLGREDVGLTEKLLRELPGVLNWSLDGLDRLNGRGRFTQPETGMAEGEAARRLADPIGAFVDDWCVVADGEEVLLDHLFQKYQNWCESDGRTRDSTTKEIFSRDLQSKYPLTVKRIRVSGKQTRQFFGIGCHVM